MLGTFAKVARWSDIRDLFSGNLLKLFPPRTMAVIITSVVDGMNDHGQQNRVRDGISQNIKSLGIDLEIDTGSARKTISETPNGDDILRLYFTQIFTQDAVFLDLRSSAFEGKTWKPGRLFVRWDPEFLSAVRGMYVSFYRGSDSDFEQAVDRLGLPGHADLFRAHFGDNQEAVTFQTESFRKIFEAILAAHQTTLPPSFGILGVYLICLYEHLERLGGTYNVRQAFDDVYEAYEPIFAPEFLAGASASHQ
jgi:hypothetical protein